MTGSVDRLRDALSQATLDGHIRVRAEDVAAALSELREESGAARSLRDDVNRTVELLARHGTPEMEGEGAYQALRTHLAKRHEPVYPIDRLCGDVSGPNGVGGECVLGPGHPHRDGIGGEWPASGDRHEELLEAIHDTPGMPLLPWKVLHTAARRCAAVTS